MNPILRSMPFAAAKLQLTIGLALASQSFSMVQAATISLQPVADTTLQQAFPDNNFGGGTSFTAGGRRNGGITRALVQFDIAGNLPAGAVISSASLTLTVVSVPSGAVN